MKANITYGLEAEFLCLSPNGDIKKLAGHLLHYEDEVGVDGHDETIEIRLPPTSTAREQLVLLEKAVTKYRLLLQSSSTNVGVGMRGGAFYRTPLGIHVHFGSFESKRIVAAIDFLHSLLINKFVANVGDQEEAASRYGHGYGVSTFPNSFRVKGPDWWEWREPSSILVPACMRVLLETSEVIAQLVHQKSENRLKRLLSYAKNPEFPLAYFLTNHVKDLDIDVDLHALAGLADRIVKIGPLDWSKNLLPLWSKQAGGDN